MFEFLHFNLKVCSKLCACEDYKFAHFHWGLKIVRKRDFSNREWENGSRIARIRDILRENLPCSAKVKSARFRKKFALALRAKSKKKVLLV